mgnify:CR=1 FL=1
MTTLEKNIEEAVETASVTLRAIRDWVSWARSQTEFHSQTNHTYYPASWTYGGGVADAMTGDYCDYGDTGLRRAAEHVVVAMGLDLDHLAGDFDDLTRSRDAAAVIARAYREQQAEDAKEDQTG